MKTYEETVAAGGSRVSGGARPWMIILLSVVLSGPSGAAGQTAGAADADPAAGATTESAPRVELGRLLRLPDSYQRPAESRRGMGQNAWESRFELARLGLYTAQLALEKAQTELGEVADDSSQWSVAAPGTNPNPENTPLSYKLRQEIRRQRESIERAERKLRSLEIEADLADVPAGWRATQVGRPPQDSARTPSRAERVAQ